MSKSEQVEQMVDAAVQVYGRLDCCLNNAGIAQPPKRLHRVEEKEFNKVVDVNLRGISSNYIHTNSPSLHTRGLFVYEI